VAKKDSAIALSKHDPVRPMDWRMLSFFNVAANWAEV